MMFRDHIVSSIAFKMGILSVAVCVVLMVTRVIFAISFSEPLLTVTSGAQYETEFGIWKYIYGDPVYSDPKKIPFTGSWYNWLFYVVYGESIGFWLSLLELEDAWITTIARFISLGSTLLGGFVAYLAFVLATGNASVATRKLAAIFAVFLFFGPLVGFWAISVFPEVMATLFSVAAILIFLHLDDRQPYLAIFVAGAFSLIAWSLKQTHVLAAGSIALFLLINRDWRKLTLFCGLHVLLFAITIAVGSSEYIKLLFYHLPIMSDLLYSAEVSGIEFEWPTLLRNLQNLVVKTVPLIVAAVLVVCALFRGRVLRSTFRTRNPLLLAICGVVISAGLAVPASAKVGAAENYYFMLAFFMGLSFFASLPLLNADHRLSRLWPGALTLGWLINMAAVGSVLAGLQGTISTRSGHDRLSAQRECIQETTGPRFSTIPELSLPWINPSGPYFVLSYNYPAERQAGGVFERAGIAGLIRDRYFGTVIIGDGGEPIVDGVDLADFYAPQGPICAGIRLFVRKKL